MNEYTSLIIGGVWGLVVFAATVLHMNRKARLKSALMRTQPLHEENDSQLVR